MTTLMSDTYSDGIEAAARLVEPKRPRPCDCERCDCHNSGDLAAVTAWDADAAAAKAIRALRPEPSAADALSPATEVRREANLEISDSVVTAIAPKIEAILIDHLSTDPPSMAIDGIQSANDAILEVVSEAILALPCADEAAIRADEREKCAKIAGWTCAARRQSLPEPADCNWPDCGCDPHATKVIESLVEQGWRAPPPPIPWDAHANRSYEPVETRAKEIYDGFIYDGPCEKPAWAPGGNGNKQDEARVIARREIRNGGKQP